MGFFDGEFESLTLTTLKEAIHLEIHCIFFFVSVSSLSHVGFFQGEFGSLEVIKQFTMSCIVSFLGGRIFPWPIWIT